MTDTNHPGPSEEERYRVTAKGSCLVAALEYEAAFGPDPQGRSAIEVADEMYARLYPNGEPHHD